MQQSSRRTPCPSCGRTRDGDCRWNAGAIWCHQGSHNGPDPELRVGDVIDIDGKPWALLSRDAGFAGSAALFRPHRERSDSPRRHIPQRQIVASHLSELESLQHALDRFEANACQVLTLPPLEEVLDCVIKDAQQLAQMTVKDAERLIDRVTKAKRLDNTLEPVLQLLKDLKFDLTYQSQHIDKWLASIPYRYAFYRASTAEIPEEPAPPLDPIANYWAAPDPNYKPKDPIVQQLHDAWLQQRSGRTI